MKINNSYESESASSGSSLSENNDYLSLDSMNLPFLMKPSKVNMDVKTAETPNLKTTPASSSSQESPFRGFSESPLEKTKLRLFSSQSEEGYKKATEKIYDTIITEDSCNAVDIPLKDRKDHSNGFDTQKNFELSFNGKIKSLREEKRVSTSKEDFSQSFIVRDYKMEGSPDLFADEEDGIEAEVESKENEINISKKASLLETSANRSVNCPTESSFADEQTMDNITTQSLDLTQQLYRDNCKRERELLRRIRKCLSGVPPPPSLTTPQFDLVQMVLSRKHEILNFLKPSTIVTECNEKVVKTDMLSLLKPTHTFEDVKNMPWRDILGVRYHGLSYNLNKASESNEYLGLSVVERFVGAETNSSYRRSPSSAKKRNARLKMLTQSPGNRLSHLATRRAVFSSAHLATTSQKSTSSLGPQIIIDKKKAKHRRKATPKRKTPGSKKKARKTPSSSARKRLFRCDSNKPGPSRETSKRALFQSPARLLDRHYVISKPQIKPEIATRVEKSKRALFSPDMTGEHLASQQLGFSSIISSKPLESLLKRKREDSNDDVDELSAHSSKLMRTVENLTPRALKIKSQSFCLGAGSSTSSLLTAKSNSQREINSFSSKCVGLRNIGNSTGLSSMASSCSLNSGYGGSSNSLNEKKLQRAHSEMAATSTSLTENQKKKLLWAVSQALQEKKITAKHESFKQYASVLARVVRRIFQDYYQATSTSKSETMLRLAKKYVFYVISGKSADEVYLQAKAQLDESRLISSSRLTGYIGPEEYKQLKKQQQNLSQSSVASTLSFHGSMQNLFSNENNFEILNSMIPTTNSQTLSSISNSQNQVNPLSGEIWPTESTKSASKRRPIEINPSHQNSSSKSNLGSLALRENSGQKNFTGRDQRNISPYASNSGLKAVSISDSIHAGSSAKAKRQILFDS